MKTQAFVRAAAAALSTALLAGAALAQTSQPQPVTMVDTAPPPASERNSVGAVILMEEPVIAQREAMQNIAARAPDTRTLGAGPARTLQQMLKDSEEAEKKKNAK